MEGIQLSRPKGKSLRTFVAAEGRRAAVFRRAAANPRAGRVGAREGDDGWIRVVGALLGISAGPY